MKKNKEQKTKKPMDKGQIFTKVMMGILVFMMLFSSIATLIYAFI